MRKYTPKLFLIVQALSPTNQTTEMNSNILPQFDSPKDNLLLHLISNYQ